jgi:class 3 adenylate cyclase
VPKAREGGLRAVLFTDVVGSTELAREMGDVRWSRLLAAQRRVIRSRLKASGGREVDTAGDGFFAVFDRPADAVRCAFDACREVQELGLDIRGGVHFGEVETRGTEVHGIVVHTGARVMGVAGAAEVVVTATVKDLVAGATFDLQERETVELKGVPGTWTLYDVMAVDDQLRPAPIESASVASERRDRAAVAPPTTRRRSWLLPVAAVVVILGVLGAYVALRPSPTFTPGEGTVAAIGEEGTFSEPVELASIPTGIAWGADRLWVTDQLGQIHWLDPASGDTGSRGSAGVPTGVAVGDDAVWVTNGFGIGAGALGGVSKIDIAGETLEPGFETPVRGARLRRGAGSTRTAGLRRAGTADRRSLHRPGPSTASRRASPWSSPRSSARCWSSRASSSRGHRAPVLRARRHRRRAHPFLPLSWRDGPAGSAARLRPALDHVRLRTRAPADAAALRARDLAAGEPRSRAGPSSRARLRR